MCTKRFYNFYFMKNEYTKPVENIQKHGIFNVMPFYINLENVLAFSTITASVVHIQVDSDFNDKKVGRLTYHICGKLVLLIKLIMMGQIN